MEIYNKVPNDLQLKIKKYIKINFMKHPYNKLINEFKKKRKVYSWCSSLYNNTISVFFYFDDDTFDIKNLASSPKTNFTEYIGNKNDMEYLLELRRKEYFDIMRYNKYRVFDTFFK